jgi:hypothetical protein
MTDRRRRPGPLPVIASAVATFLAVLTLLAVQLQAGHDPVLGGGRAAISSPAGGHQKKVVTRTSGGGVATQATAGNPFATVRRQVQDD